MSESTKPEPADVTREPGAPHSKLGHFMRTMGHLRSIYGPAAHRDLAEEEAHGHNPEDIKETEELKGIDVRTDSLGHHYGVRRAQAEAPRAEGEAGPVEEQ